MNSTNKIHLKFTSIIGIFFLMLLINLIFWSPIWAAPPADSRARQDAVVGTGTPASCTEAALEAALATGGLITFNCGNAPHTILLSSVKSLDMDVMIDGDGLITLSGNNTTGLFNIRFGATVVLRELSLTDAPTTATAIYNAGTLAVVEARIYNNPRGGIYNAGGTVSAIRSTFEENHAPVGGAITNENAGTLLVSASTFRNNSTTTATYGGAVYGSTGSNTTILYSLFENNNSETGSGGAIANSHAMTIEQTIIRDNFAAQGGGIYNGGFLTIRNSHITGNVATSGGGGGILHYNQTINPSSLTLLQTTIDNNRSGQNGGGIWLSGPVVLLEATNTTLYSNTAETIGGGGLYVTEGDATLTNVTLSDNVSQATDGDNIENSQTAPGTLIIRNTLVVNGGCQGGLVDGDGNLEYPESSCGFDTPSADPELGNLADNGGWVPTMAIGENGPAQNMATNANCPAIDQRGVLRPQFETCDIGAFEWGALPILASITPTSTLVLSPTFDLQVNGSNFIAGPSGSRVLWQGEALPTTYIDGTTLFVNIPASYLATSKQVSITVQTPVVDGGVSSHTAIFTILKRDQSINFDELPDRSLESTTFELEASATSGLAIEYQATGICRVEGNTVTLDGVGTCTITATQAGNENYNAAPNVSRSFEVIDTTALYLPHVFSRAN